MGASDQKRTCIRFGSYEFDSRTGMLRKDGIRIRCQEQPLQVLAALVERPGELVTREELRRRVWPEDTFVDFDHALNTAIKKIRASLNDDADAPRYIETVPKRGYRFIAPVQSETTAGPAGEPSVQVPVRKGHRILAALGGIAALVLVILGLSWRLAPWQGEASSSPEFVRITFQLPEPGEARFSPDGASVIYSSGWHTDSASIYSQRVGASASQKLTIPNSTLLAVSPQSELVVLSEAMSSRPSSTDHQLTGTLAQVPLEGGSPRELLPAAEAADWSSRGQLAVVKRVGNKSQLEYPAGKVLYETAGWIADPRFSPSGDAIAFLDHPSIPDDRGTVAIVDLSGNKKTLSGFWESLRGLAWRPSGDEVWFAAARSGVARALYGVNLNGQERQILSVPGGLSLDDISRDGRVLLSRDNERIGIKFIGAGDAEPRELSWKDWSSAMDISPDGKQILFGEEGENSGLSYQVGLRKTDGTPPVILGSGSAQSLSPDGMWALSIMPAPDNQIMLLPTGAGSAKALDRGPVLGYQHVQARWFPDSRQIVFVGYEEGHGMRCYVQSIEGGKPHAFTPDGMTVCTISPKGQILAVAADRRALVYSSASSERPDRELKLAQGDWPAGWTPDGKFVYLVQTRQMPATITRYELATGKRSLWKQIPLEGFSATMQIMGAVITPDGQSLAYTYCDESSDLYVVSRLK
jgi:eukaryotic-like serine/threonine-protein kinase